MSVESRDAVLLGEIQALFGLGVVQGLTDGHLLERFLTADDITAEAAFTSLVERHGPTVLHVCRGILDEPQDAQDAFQATVTIPLVSPIFGVGALTAFSGQGSQSAEEKSRPNSREGDRSPELEEAFYRRLKRDHEFNDPRWPYAIKVHDVQDRTLMPDGKTLAYCDSQSVGMIDVQSGRLERTLKTTTLRPRP